MLKVVKRKGNIVDFNHDKIRTSVENSARDAGIYLTAGELDMIAREVEKTIINVRGEDGTTSSYEIRGVVVRVLKAMGYRNVAMEFYSGKEK
jgi:transcriptional regulator NrdR family protein